MAKKKIDFAEKIEKVLTEYGESLQENLEEVTAKLGRAGAKEIREKAKATFGGSGDYAAGWTSKAENTRLSSTAIIYNRDHYQLAHLLEFGHAKRNGGRVEGKAHIKPVEDKLIDTFEKELSNKL